QERQDVGIERQTARALERNQDRAEDDGGNNQAPAMRPSDDGGNQGTHERRWYVTFSDPIMNVLLLRPVPANERFGLGPFFRIEPLGMEYIAAALEARGHRVTLDDLRFTRSVASQMRIARPGLVGIAAMHALETDEVVALARRVRTLS